jgi:hypothetical protein
LNEEAFLTIVFGGIVLGGFVLVAMTISARQRMRELAMRERIAMIEKGLVPPPEVDPLRFERLVSTQPRPVNSRGARYRSAGIILVGLGLGLLLLIAAAADSPDVGFGVGGGLAVLGAAVYFNGVLLARDELDHGLVGPAAPIESRRPEPPTNVGP